MGYWSTSREGVSFAENEDGPEMIWGDTPADIFDAAISAIAAQFVADEGRMPDESDIRLIWWSKDDSVIPELARIKASEAFERDMGRAATTAELEAGLSFSLGGGKVETQDPDHDATTTFRNTMTKWGY